MGKWREINFFAQQVTVPAALSDRAAPQRVQCRQPRTVRNGRRGCELLATLRIKMALHFQFDKLHGLQARSAVIPVLRIVRQRRSITTDRCNSA